MPDPERSAQDEMARLRADNEELLRLLEKHQFGGLTPASSVGACPECGGSASRGHRAGCAIATALAAYQR